MCTENLTPWMDLLACRNAAGIGAVITPSVVFDASHHFFTLEFDTSPSTGEVTLVQQLLYVSSAQRDRWTHEHLFGTSATGLTACPLAERSTLTLDFSAWDGDVATKGGLAGGVEHTIGSTSSPLVVDFALPKRAVPSSFPPPPLDIARHMSGFGQERGTMVTRVYSADEATLRLVDTVPWYLRVHFYSLRVTMNGVPVHPLPVRRLQPSSVRGAPAVLELELRFPRGGGNVSVTWDFRKAFLRVSEHPPDAHHGLHLPAAALFNGTSNRAILYSDVVVSIMPLPDFSMPFNVVALSGIILGFYFGAILRAVTTKYSDLKRGKTESLQSQRPIAKLARFLLRLIDGQ